MLIPVILSGGNGSRLWPVSRETYPKPFIRINDEPHSLIQKTYQRTLNIPHIEKIITVTNFEYYYHTKKELTDLGYDPASNTFNFILEPFSRNTAAAIIFSAFFTKEVIHPDATLLVLPADHIILNQDKFNACVEKAKKLAEKELLTLFGIIPYKPETAYGYIQYSKTDEILSAYKVIQFYEKPTYKNAQSFIEEGNYLWNSGILCFRVKTFLETVKKYIPAFYLKSLACWNHSVKKNVTCHNKLRLDEPSFTALENISIDYALLEKADNITVIPSDFGWSDVGSWDVLNTFVKLEENNNRILGDVFLKETYNTNIYSQHSNRVIGLLGIKNLTIVDTPDALLICQQSHIQNVKQLVEELKRNDHPAYRYHQTVYRPWGHYTVLDEGPHYKLKRLLVYPGASLSVQMHRYRSEYWVVVSGVATIKNDQKQLILYPNESTFIPLGCKHCLSNLEKHDLIVIEVQTGSYLGEDDIIRFKDNYERKTVTDDEANIDS